jgi:hypothetical protein
MKAGDFAGAAMKLESALRDTDWDLTGSEGYVEVASLLVEAWGERDRAKREAEQDSDDSDDEGGFMGLKKAEFLVAAAPPKTQGALLLKYLHFCAGEAGEEGVRRCFEFARRSVAAGGAGVAEFGELCLAAEGDRGRRREVWRYLEKLGGGDPLLERWATEEGEEGGDASLSQQIRARMGK